MNAETKFITLENGDKIYKAPATIPQKSGEDDNKVEDIVFNFIKDRIDGKHLIVADGYYMSTINPYDQNGDICANGHIIISVPIEDGKPFPTYMDVHANFMTKVIKMSESAPKLNAYLISIQYIKDGMKRMFLPSQYGKLIGYIGLSNYIIKERGYREYKTLIGKSEAEFTSDNIIEAVSMSEDAIILNEPIFESATL